jgi:uncharacterized membrane protein
VVDLWTLIRFVHVVGAALWVGGQLALTLVITPVARRLLGTQQQMVVGALAAVSPA